LTVKCFIVLATKRDLKKERRGEEHKKGIDEK
jgi:fibronectin type 3 domain-containing protein